VSYVAYAPPWSATDDDDKRQRAKQWTSNKHASLTKNTYKHKIKKLKQSLVTSYDIRPGNGVGLSGRMEKIEKQKIDKASEKEKKGKSNKY